MQHRYGSYPLKGKYCHEMALRILLACIEVIPFPIEDDHLSLVRFFFPFLVLMLCSCSLQMQSHANRYKRYIVPILSVQMDFYIRVFVRIYT